MEFFERNLPVSCGVDADSSFSVIPNSFPPDDFDELVNAE